MPVLGDHNRASHHPHVGPRPPGQSQPAAHLGPHEEPEFRSASEVQVLPKQEMIQLPLLPHLKVEVAFSCGNLIYTQLA